jgi:SAM-dependent methyltransferase
VPEPEAAAEQDEPRAADLEARWADRVRANREQVDRVREVPDGHDFYGPVSALFVADPRRERDDVLDALVGLTRAGETWLDVGSGAGRYALPLALRVGRVIALDPSASMLAALRDGMERHGIANVDPIEGRWPPEPALLAEFVGAFGTEPIADVSLIAHVGYDVESIGPFVDALASAARLLCVAVLMERPPAAVASPFWPPVHGEERVPLPALGEFVELLRARGSTPDVEIVDQPARRWSSRDDILGFLRRQLWVEPGGARDIRLAALLDERLVAEEEGFVLGDADPIRVGIVTWQPR